MEGERAGTKRLGDDGAAATGERRTATVVKERRDDEAAPRTEEAAPARAWSVACIVSLAREGERETERATVDRFGFFAANERDGVKNEFFEDDVSYRLRIFFSSFDFTLFLKKTSSQKKNENDDRKRAPGDTCELAAKGQQQQQQQRRRCRLHFLICSR